MDFVFSLAKPVVALAVALLLSFCFSRRWGSSAKLRPAPEVPGGWPIVGHLFMLRRGQPPHRTLGAMADKYGPIFTIRLGAHPTLVVSNSTMAKECMVNNEAALFARPHSLAAKYLSYDFALFAFSNDAAYWRLVRKVIASELFSNRRLEQLKHVIVSELDVWIAEVHDIWFAEKVKNSSGNKAPVELKELFFNLSYNVIMKLLVGKRYFGSRKEGNEEEARRFSKAQETFFHYLGMFMASDAIPFLAMFDFGGHQKGMKEVAEEMDNIVGGWLEEHKKRRVSGVPENEKDFMDAMLSTLAGEEELHGYSPDTVTKATVLTVIAAASDTIAVVLTWATSLLLNNPHAMKTVQIELDDKIGRERTVNDSDMGNLVYLQAIFKETLRLYPPGPLTGTREFTEDCIVGGYHIPKGTRFIPNLWRIQTDPEVWSEPLEFKPERFLTKHKYVDGRGNHFELIPFGSGRRICPGINFAMQMVPFALARFLQAFDVETPSKEPVDMTESTAFTNMKTTPLQALISPRLSAQIFPILQN